MTTHSYLSSCWRGHIDLGYNVTIFYIPPTPNPNPDYFQDQYIDSPIILLILLLFCYIIIVIVIIIDVYEIHDLLNWYGHL